MTEMTRAIAFVLRERGYLAGKWRVGYQSCDGSTAQAGRWDAAKAAANAQAYVQDTSVVGVIGPFNSGAAAIMIPVLNRASGGPLALVSPANTGVGLTHDGPGADDGDPGRYYPSGRRNYARIVAADDYQGAASALLAQRLGKKSVYALHDGSRYGRGIATSFRDAARELDLSVAGFEEWDPAASGYAALAAKIAKTGAEVVYLGGLVTANGGKLVADLANGVGEGVQLMASDGFTPIEAVVQSAGAAAAEGLTVSVAGLPNSALRGRGRVFLAAFRKVIGREPDPYSVYAAQATEVLLDAIARSDGSRASVTAQLFRTKVKNGILGTFAIDANGDTTTNPVTIYRVRKGKAAPFRAVVPPSSLVSRD